MKKKVEEIVQEIAAPIIDRHHFELVDIEYKKEGPDWYLRIYIDKDGGITVDDCELISEEVGVLIDEADPIANSYFFEVSSPGIERPLKTKRDFEKNMGKLIEVKFFKPFEGKKSMEGILSAYTDETIEVEVNQEIKVIDRKLVSLMKPVIVF